MNGEGRTALTTGQHEFLTVGGIDGNTVYFTSTKEQFYGSEADSDSGIGTGNHDMRVQVVRVPHYSDLTVDGTLSGKGWDGTSGGVMAFRVAGTLDGSGVIEMNGDGYRGVEGCGESISGTDCGSGGGQKGGTRSEHMPKGGGGAHTTNGATGTRNGDGLGGLAYATPGSERLYPGSAGGKGGCLSEVDGTTCGGVGGNGGGVITILASEVAMTNGVISSLGEGGGTASGSGAGGSIQVEGENISLGQALVAGGIRNIAGGNGSSYAIYRGTLTSAVFGSELDLDAPVATPGPTPTPTAAPTLNPASAVWHTRGYNYANAHPNRVTGTTEEDSYTYDENGNQVERLVDGVSWTLAYNAENRLASLGDGNGNSEAYLYDGDGVCVARVRSGEATYLFMGGLYEVNVSVPAGTVTGIKSYYTIEGLMLAMNDGSSTSYMLTDHLGSIVGVVGEDGALVSEQRYLPFGEARTLVGAPLTDLSFTGQRELTGTGLLDYHARQYDPGLRVFIQADSIIPNPYGVLDYSRYLYVHANPVRFTDPSGNMPCDGPELGDGCGVSAKPPVQSPVVLPNDPFIAPEYSNWRDLINGSPCTGCHVTHDGYLDNGRIPDNSRLDGWLVDYYRSLDELAALVHEAGFSYILFLSSLPLSTYTVEVSEAKIEYLLTNTGKSPGFNQLGYSSETLKTDLEIIGGTVKSSDFSTLTEWGQRFKKTIHISRGNVNAQIITVWQIDNGAALLRLITSWVEIFK